MTEQTSKNRVTFSSIYDNGTVGASYLNLDIIRSLNNPVVTHALRTEIKPETLTLVSSEVIVL